MAFISTPIQLSHALEELLETPVSPKIIEKLAPSEFRFICSIMYQKGTEEKIKVILNKAKTRLPKKQYSPNTQMYLRNKGLI